MVDWKRFCIYWIILVCKSFEIKLYRVCSVGSKLPIWVSIDVSQNKLLYDDKISQWDEGIALLCVQWCHISNTTGLSKLWSMDVFIYWWPKALGSTVSLVFKLNHQVIWIVYWLSKYLLLLMILLLIFSHIDSMPFMVCFCSGDVMIDYARLVMTSQLMHTCESDIQLV